jgi:Tfp pilus assembly protein PilF
MPLRARATMPDDLRVRTLLAAGTALYNDGHDEAAGRDLRQAVNLARQRLKASNPLRSAALTGLADLLADGGDYAEAEMLCREALMADRARPPTRENQAVLADTLNSFGTTLFDRGDFAAAIVPMREALKLRETALGRESPVTGELLNNLGAVLYMSGQYQGAVKEYEQALPIYKKVYGAEHPEIATLLNNIGRSDLMAGDIANAEPLMQEALSMTEKFEGTRHEDLIAPLNSLAMIDLDNGRLLAAQHELERADSIANSTGQTGLLDQVVLNEARLAVENGDVSLATPLLARSKLLLQKAHPQSPSEAWRYAVWDIVNAQVLAAQGDTASASKILNAAEKVIDGRFGSVSYYGQRVRKQLTLIGKPAAAKRM